MALQAKCPKCKVRYIWDRDVPLNRAYCPICKTSLEATTYQSALPTERITELYNPSTGYIYVNKEP